jgi:hypothetical protein
VRAQRAQDLRPQGYLRVNALWKRRITLGVQCCSAGNRWRGAHRSSFLLDARQPVACDADYGGRSGSAGAADGDQGGNDTVELDEQAFARYMCGQWKWRDDFDVTRGYHVEEFGRRRARRGRAPWRYRVRLDPARRHRSRTCRVSGG